MYNITLNIQLKDKFTHIYTIKIQLVHSRVLVVIVHSIVIVIVHNIVIVVIVYSIVVVIVHSLIVTVYT